MGDPEEPPPQAARAPADFPAPTSSCAARAAARRAARRIAARGPRPGARGCRHLCRAKLRGSRSAPSPPAASARASIGPSPWAMCPPHCAHAGTRVFAEVRGKRLPMTVAATAVRRTQLQTQHARITLTRTTFMMKFTEDHEWLHRGRHRHRRHHRARLDTARRSGVRRTAEGRRQAGEGRRRRRGRIRQGRVRRLCAAHRRSGRSQRGGRRTTPRWSTPIRWARAGSSR